MSVKEKLVELLTDNLPRIGDLPKCDNPLQYKSDEIVERIAAHLELNGVTVQEWISVDERLPTNEGKYLVCTAKGKVYVENFVDYYGNGKRLCFVNYTVTHWMPLPETPKGE